MNFFTNAVNGFPDLFQQNLIYVVAILSLGLVMAIFQIFVDKLKISIPEIFRKLFTSSTQRGHHIPSDSYTRVLNELIELRIKTDSDRAFIFQFHNGEHFGGNNPRWKMSQTYETCADNITYTGSRMQNLDVTLFWDTLQLFYRDGSPIDMPGVMLYESENHCSATEPGRCRRQIYVVDVVNMDSNKGYSKSILAQAGVKYMLASPIISLEQEVIGFIGISYCSEDAYTDIINSVEFDGTLLCQSSTNIGLIWALDSDLRKKALKIARKNA